MNPLKYQEEISYYNRILNEYNKKIDGKRDPFQFDTFSAREIISLMREIKSLHNEKEEEKLADIAKNSIILILSLFGRQRADYFRNFSELNEDERKNIKEELIPMICNSTNS